MIKEEAHMIARIISTADGRCSSCVSSLAKRMQLEFPEFTWSYNRKEYFLELDGEQILPHETKEEIQDRLELWD